MKRLLIGAIMIGAVAGQLAAQANLSGGVVVLSFGGLLVPGTSSLNFWSDPPCDRPAQAGRHGDKGFPYWGYACDPSYAGPAPSVTVAIPQVAAPPVPPPPAPTIRPEVREYNWPSFSSDSSATTFSIISKDGRVQSASMVWVQDDAVCYATPDGGQDRMPIDSIDRKATRQRNADQQLNWLPAGD